MKIAIEAERANNPVKTGVEHYAKQLILHMARLDNINDFVLYLRTEPERWIKDLPNNFITKIISFPLFWTQVRLSLAMLFDRPDCLFVPASAMPIISPKASVVTIHDCAWVYYPEAFTKNMRRYLHYSTKFAVWKAKRVIAVSESTKNDLVKYYRVNPNKVDVILHGYEEVQKDFSKLSTEVSAKLPEKYILFLSTLQPRKNLPALINAFAELKKTHPELPHKLVVVGKPGWQYEESLEAIKQHQDVVVYLNHVSDDDRWPIYNRASLFIHPSLYEGFGMWMLEAFECGVPVAVSNVSSLPEVGGDAAIYFDPKNSDSIKQAILKVLTDDVFAEQLRQKGYQRLKDFSWEKCAQQTIESLKNSLR